MQQLEMNEELEKRQSATLQSVDKPCKVCLERSRTRLMELLEVIEMMMLQGKKNSLIAMGMPILKKALLAVEIEKLHLWLNCLWMIGKDVADVELSDEEYQQHAIELIRKMNE